MTNGTSSLRVCVQRGGITCLFSSKAFSENDFTKHDSAGDGGRNNLLFVLLDTLLFLERTKTRTLLGASVTSAHVGDIFQKGVHSVCNRFKSSLLPSVAASLSLLGLADVWGSFLGSLGRQRATCSQCQPDFRGNSYERRIALHKETEPLSLPATFRFSFSYSPISSSNSLFVIFGFFSSLRLSPADFHPQITLCIK